MRRVWRSPLAWSGRTGVYGDPAGSFRLPKGRTVQDLSRETVSGGPRSAGLRVLEPGDPGYATAVPLEIRVLHFWSWYEGQPIGNSLGAKIAGDPLVLPAEVIP